MARTEGVDDEEYGDGLPSMVGDVELVVKLNGDDDDVRAGEWDFGGKLKRLSGIACDGPPGGLRLGRCILCEFLDGGPNP